MKIYRNLVLADDGLPLAKMFRIGNRYVLEPEPYCMIGKYFEILNWLNDLGYDIS